VAKNANLAGSKLDRIDTFVVSGVVTILATRAYLSIADYPQIGGDNLHIAHVLFGGFFLVLALLLLLLSERPNKLLAAFLGGVGFGLFIDEVGKFVTNDNDYFYEPAVGIMYICFLLIWFISRLLIVRTSKTPFLSPAEWPEQKVLRIVIVLWAAIQIIGTGLLIGVTAVLGLNNVADILDIPRAGVALSWVYAGFLALGLQRYYKNQMLRASHTLRGTTLFGVVAVYPFIYIYYPLLASFGMAGMLLVIIGLSEISLYKVIRKILYNTQVYWSGILPKKKG
jgi:hypothetical protein